MVARENNIAFLVHPITHELGFLGMTWCMVSLVTRLLDPVAKAAAPFTGPPTFITGPLESVLRVVATAIKP